MNHHLLTIIIKNKKIITVINLRHSHENQPFNKHIITLIF